MCEISYIKIKTPCCDIFITSVNINDATFPIRISFTAPETLILPKNINYSSFIPENSIPVSDIEKAINDSLSGASNDFDALKLLKFYHFSSFQKEVYRQLHQIERGKTISYRQLAATSGNHSASRAVGNIMSTNPYVILIPCHRVIKSDGKTGGFAGRPELKIVLLERESKKNNTIT